MPKLRLGDLETYYEVHGDGETVLLVPPSFWPSDTWKLSVVPNLSERYRTIIFDPRGTGQSGKPTGGYTVSQFAQDCLELLSALEVARCHVVGFAIGGQVAQAMAVEHPERIATLTMAASGPGTRTLAGGQRDLATDTDPRIEELGFERYIRGYPDNDTMAFNPEFYREHHDIVAALADALWSGQSTPEQFHRHESARLTWDTLGEAARVKVPTLVLCGEGDEVSRRGSTPVDTARRLGAAIPGAELVLVPGVKHMTFWDGDGALAALRDFLERHPTKISLKRNLGEHWKNRN